MTNHAVSQKPAAAEIKIAAHSGDLADLTMEQLVALAQFVQQAGGIKQAQRAIESLEMVKKAA